MFSIKVEYPSFEEEKKILAGSTKSETPELAKVLTIKEILNLQKLIRNVPVGDYVLDYVARLVRATRPGPEAPEMVKRTVDFGAGVRAGQFLVRAGQAFAAMEGRFSVSIDDIRKAAEPVLRHRIGANFQAQAEGKTTEDIVRHLVETIPEPDVAKYGNKPVKR